MVFNSTSRAGRIAPVFMLQVATGIVIFLLYLVLLTSGLKRAPRTMHTGTWQNICIGHAEVLRRLNSPTIRITTTVVSEISQILSNVIR